MPTRTDIRQALVSLLTGLPTTGINVYTNQARFLSDVELPAVLISSGAVTTDSPSEVCSQRPVVRAWSLHVDLIVSATEAAEGTLDVMLDEVESAAFASVDANTLGGRVAHLQLKSVGGITYSHEHTEKRSAHLTLVFEAYYS